MMGRGRGSREGVDFWGPDREVLRKQGFPRWERTCRRPLAEGLRSAQGPQEQGLQQVGCGRRAARFPLETYCRPVVLGAFC